MRSDRNLQPDSGGLDDLLKICKWDAKQTSKQTSQKTLVFVRPRSNRVHPEGRRIIADLMHTPRVFCLMSQFKGAHKVIKEAEMQGSG